MSQITPSSQEAEGFSLVDKAVESFKFEISCQEVPEEDAALRQKKTGQNLLHAPVGIKECDQLINWTPLVYWQLPVHTLTLGYTLFQF